MSKAEELLGLLEVKGLKLAQSIKNKIGKDLDKINKQIYHRGVPLNDIFAILERHGVVALQEDGTKWSGILAGGIKDTAKATFDLGDASTKDGNTYTPYTNAALALTYYKMPTSGMYEVVVYIS